MVAFSGSKPMNRLLYPLRAGVVALLLVPLLYGCGDSIKTVPIRGKVTVGDEPVTSGNVSYVPLDTSKAAKEMSVGPIDSNGEYTIHTGGKSGAPPGKYKVVVSPSMVPTPGAKTKPTVPFNAKYSKGDTTPLEKEVKSDAPAGHYDLKLEK
jgi:hypothetical protein